MPLSEPPFGDNEKLDLGMGVGGGVGFYCGVSGRLGLGAEVEVLNLEQLLLVHVLGGAGTRFSLDDGDRAAWFGLTAKGGLAVSAEIGSRSAFEPIGEAVDLDSLGLALAVGARLGLPLAGRSTLFLDTSLHLSFLPKRVFPDNVGAGLTGFASLPISIGVEIDP